MVDREAQPINLSFDRGTLLLQGLDPGRLPVVGDSRIWTWDPRVGAWRCDAIHYTAAADNVLVYKTALKLEPLMAALEAARGRG